MLNFVFICYSDFILQVSKYITKQITNSIINQNKNLVLTTDKGSVTTHFLFDEWQEVLDTRFETMLDGISLLSCSCSCTALGLS